jgi:RimJ/RimL family protein N-acetyltransferase
MEPRPLPEPLESERLLLRCPRVGDAPAVLDAIRETFDDLHAWLPWAERTPTLEDQRAHVRETRRRFEAREDFTLYLFEREGGAFVGGSGLHRIDWSVPRFEIGYWVRASRQGRGYAREAARALAAAAFERLGAARVEIRADPENARSRRVAEAAGFELEGILRRDIRHRGALRDTAVYARIR